MGSDHGGLGDLTADRRMPVARYVQFHDEATQAAFIAAAEAAYRAMTVVSRWRGSVRFELPVAEAPQPRRRFRRTRVEPPAARPSLSLATGVAEAATAALEVPPRVAALQGCTAQRLLAACLGEVVMDLVTDLAEEAPADQVVHPAYVQTERLAAELTAMHTTLVERGCQDPDGCVSARPPEHWGRRLEDVEVAEVRAVLVQLAEAGRRQAEPDA